ncbi:methionine--tRNA ligase, partial [Candidatus Woesearchaeota archaeon]|nr:methionine--tRNA ligase [Candidatus Woesearchaeota archaeon]
HPNADKLLVLKVDIGSKVIQLVAGLRKNYDLRYLIGKKIIVFTNLEPIELRGIKSEGMLLAAVDEKNDKVVFLTPEKDVSKGAKIR